MDLSANVGSRLREERERLCLSQEEMAEKVDVRREMWSKYERDLAIPSGDTLMKAIYAGVDVRYVLTGDRDFEPSKRLSAREESLIDNYRNADEEGKKAAHKMLDALSKQNKDGKKRA